MTRALLAEGGGRLVMYSAGPTSSLGGVGGCRVFKDFKGDGAILVPVEAEAVELDLVAAVEHVDKAMLDVLVLCISEVGYILFLIGLLASFLFALILATGLGVVRELDFLVIQPLFAERDVLLFHLARDALGLHLDSILVLGRFSLLALGRCSWLRLGRWSGS